MTEPVFKKFTALVTVAPAFKVTLYAALAAFNVVAVSAPLKAIVPVVLLRVTVVAATVLEKVVPPELVMVRVPISVPTAPLTETAPAELMVRLDDVPLGVPETLDKFTAPAPELVSVRLALSARVRAPKVMVPVPVETEAVPLEVVVPRVIVLFDEVSAPFTAVEPAV